MPALWAVHSNDSSNGTLPSLTGSSQQRRIQITPPNSVTVGRSGSDPHAHQLVTFSGDDLTSCSFVDEGTGRSQQCHCHSPLRAIHRVCSAPFVGSASAVAAAEDEEEEVAASQQCSRRAEEKSQRATRQSRPPVNTGRGKEGRRTGRRGGRGG